MVCVIPYFYCCNIQQSISRHLKDKIIFIILELNVKMKEELKVVLVGVCTYLVAQILFRQPFLALLQSIDSYRILITTNRVAHIAILAGSAAIAEEIGRYIAFRFFVKGQPAQNTPLYFGLGHGGIEARRHGGTE